MTGILKDFNFVIAYLDDIIIFSKTLQEHLSPIRMVFKKLHSAKLSMKLSKCHFFLQGNPVFRTHFEHKRDLTTATKTQAIQKMQPPTIPKQV